MVPTTKKKTRGSKLEQSRHQTPPIGIFQGTSTHREQEKNGKIHQKSIWKSQHLRQHIPSSRCYSSLCLLQIAIVVPFLAPFFACLILIDHFGSTKIGTSSNLSITRLSSFSISLSPQGNFEKISAELQLWIYLLNICVPPVTSDQNWKIVPWQFHSSPNLAIPLDTNIINTFLVNKSPVFFLVGGGKVPSYL